jgi:hypothetical protein
MLWCCDVRWCCSVMLLVYVYVGVEAVWHDVGGVVVMVCGVWSWRGVC